MNTVFLSPPIHFDNQALEKDWQCFRGGIAWKYKNLIQAILPVVWRFRAAIETAPGQSRAPYNENTVTTFNLASGLNI